jgi:STE24 endopeptidase
MHWFTVVFLLALGVATAARYWLARRQIAHITAHRAAVPSEFVGRIALEAHQKAADYTVAKTRLGMLETFVEVALLLALTVGGLLQLASDLVSMAFDTRSYTYSVALIVCVVVFSGLIDMPFSLYRVFGIETRFGFNRMTLRLFVTDLAKQLALGAVIGVPLLYLVLWLMDRMGQTWWLYVWLTLLAYSLIAQIVYPTVLARWFNKFSPLEDETLKSRIEALVAKCGFRTKGLFVMDGSKRSSHGNAYFTGFGATKRIILFDTLVSRLQPPEVEAVLAHELGHFSLHHVWKRLLVAFAVSLAMLWILSQLAQQAWFYSALGVHTQSMAAALLLFSLIAPAFMFFLHPLSSVYSRKHEYEADAFAARHADASDMIHALVKLYQDNAATLTPDPLHSAFYDSHPPAMLRIARLQAQQR